MKHKRMAGNLIYPATKIFLAGATASNLSDFMKVVPAANAGTSGLGRFLHLPQHGIVISEEQDTYEIELVEGHEGTKRMVVVTIGNPDACTECSFEYGFGVSQVQYYRRRYEDPKKHITAGYYDRMSNPAAINPTTGKFTDATMQAMLSDKKGRVLIIEPGIGYRYEQENFSLITNYSILKPDITKPYIVSGDTRYEVAKELLAGYDKDFSVNDAFKVLKSVSQKDLWATRVSFVYSTEKNKVYYVLNNDFSNVFEFQF